MLHVCATQAQYGLETIYTSCQLAVAVMDSQSIVDVATAGPAAKAIAC